MCKIYIYSYYVLKSNFGKILFGQLHLQQYTQYKTL